MQNGGEPLIIATKVMLLALDALGVAVEAVKMQTKKCGIVTDL